MDREKVLKHRSHFFIELTKTLTPNSVAVTEELREGMLQAVALSAAAVFCAKWNIPDDPAGEVPRAMAEAEAAIRGMESYAVKKDLIPDD